MGRTTTARASAADGCSSAQSSSATTHNAATCHRNAEGQLACRGGEQSSHPRQTSPSFCTEHSEGLLQAAAQEAVRM